MWTYPCYFDVVYEPQITQGNETLYKIVRRKGHSYWDRILSNLIFRDYFASWSDQWLQLKNRFETDKIQYGCLDCATRLPERRPVALRPCLSAGLPLLTIWFPKTFGSHILPLLLYQTHSCDYHTDWISLKCILRWFLQPHRFLLPVSTLIQWFKIK